MAVKKTAKKAVKAAKKVAKPAVAKSVAKKTVTGKAAAPVKNVAKKSVPAASGKKQAKAAKPAATKPAKVVKVAPKPVAKPAAVNKKLPAKPAKAVAKPKAAPVKAPVAKVAPAKSVKAARPAEAPKPAAPVAPPKSHHKHEKSVPATKNTAKDVNKSSSTAKPTPVKTAGKVAVAVVARAPAAPSAPNKRKVVEYSTDPTSGRPVLPKGYKPTADEEYMSPLQLEYFRQRLLKWRADLIEESKQTIENLKDEVRDIGDEAERATRETENSLELRTRDRYRKLIGKIDSTLKRLEAGDYGYCVDTGEEIGLERLEARLTAERTLDAQERWEHLQKQQGD